MVLQEKIICRLKKQRQKKSVTAFFRKCVAGSTGFLLFIMPSVVVAESKSDDKLVASTVVPILLLNDDPDRQTQYFRLLAEATYNSLLAMVEPTTGLIHDKTQADVLDVIPQLHTARTAPFTGSSDSASITAEFCQSAACCQSGNYGLQFIYNVDSSDEWVAWTIESKGYKSPITNQYQGFDVSAAKYLELWVKGASGGEKIRPILRANPDNWPGAPEPITATTEWKKVRVPLSSFGLDDPTFSLSHITQLTIDANYSMNTTQPSGTVYIDNIAFVLEDGTQIPVALDESTNVSNLGLWASALVAADGLDIEENYAAKANQLLDSLATLFDSTYKMWHTHNHVVSLKSMVTGNKDDACRQYAPGSDVPNLFSSVDNGNLWAGLVLLANHGDNATIKAKAQSLLDALDWSLFVNSTPGDPNNGKIYGCVDYQGNPSTWWYYDYLSADSRIAYFLGIGSTKVPSTSWSKLNSAAALPRCSGDEFMVPGWCGGGLFMAYLSGLWVKESGNAIGDSALAFAQDQQCHYTNTLGATVWGFSATSLSGIYGDSYLGYYCGRNEPGNTLCENEAFCDGIVDSIVVPHAAMFPVQDMTKAVYDNLQAIEKLNGRKKVHDGLGEYDWGFRSAVQRITKIPTTDYLSLDQGMGFLALANHLNDNAVRDTFCKASVVQSAVSLIPDYAESCQ